jgi:hypothetical protein
MSGSRIERWMGLWVAAVVVGACASGSGSQGIARGPSRDAIVVRVAAPVDTVIQRAWEVLRNDEVMARSFRRLADDTANVAHMESDWIYVPNVIQSATFGHLSEREKWIKLLFWAQPERGGTLLYIDALFNPTDLPSEPAQWQRMRSVPGAHPAWQYVEVMGTNLSRRLRGTADEEGG